MSEVEETIKRIKDHKGVRGILIVNHEGKTLRTTMDPGETHKYGNQITQLALKARHCVRDVDCQNDLAFMRIKTKFFEIMVAPGKDYLLIVLQCLADEEKYA
mmetsp:Transcript_5866/g.6535  ORF Transcript_5866/g.6535 Transcript_5866/m.6535 type:complete len:102 (-) Transcript_5866:30-335(-)